MTKVKTEKATKYFAYLRKSSEDKEKQALSIPAQKSKILERFPDLSIEFIQEEKSAFLPHNRPQFSAMLESIREGERVGLLAWHPDRLSRNEVDASSITYMLRKGEIRDLKFATYHFENNSPEGIWMLQMALSQSQYESAKKGRDVKRGLETKAKMGIYPAPAPIGYLNDKFAERGSKTIHTDPDLYPLLRKMVEMMLTGNYSPAQLQKIANKEWCFRTSNGKKLSRSTAYLIFTRPFYYGEFEYPVKSGKWYKGIHKPLMTREEYERIQFLLGRPSQARPQKHDFAYRGAPHCGACGAMITAETKFKRLADGSVAKYIYYHCTKSKDPDCTQGAIEENELEKQISAYLAKIEIPADFTEWALMRLREMNVKEFADREKITSSQRKEYDACVRQIDALIDMRANNEIDEEQFRSKKAVALEKKENLWKFLNDTDKRIETWLEVAERGFNFAEKAKVAFEHAKKTNDLILKREMFTALGSDFFLLGKILKVDLDNLLFPLQTASAEVRKIVEMLELKENVATKAQKTQLYTDNPILLRDLDSNQDTLLQRE